MAEKARDADDEAKRMRALLDQAHTLLVNDRESFQESYLSAYQVLADVALEAMSDDESGEARVAQIMFRKVKDASFGALYRKLRMRLDFEARKNASAE